MVATNADIHSIDTPSPLPTPGYLPLLSEASTPLTPATLQGTSHSTSPIANSPRISFRSFTLPLEIGDERDSSNTNKLKEASVSSSEKLSDSSHRLSINLEDQNRGLRSCERTMTTNDGRIELRDRNVTMSHSDVENQAANQSSAIASIFNNTMEITSCNRLSSLCEERKSSGITVSRKDATSESSSLDSVKISSKSYEKASAAKKRDETTDSSDNLTAVVNLPRLSSSNTTDFDSPMSCEQTLQELQESGFVICNNSDKTFTSTENPRVASNSNDSGDWVIIGRTTTGCLATPISESTSPNDPFSEGGANPTSPENDSETLLELTLTSTDAFCIGVDDTKSESHTSIQESDRMILDITDTKKYTKNHEYEREDCANDPQTSFDLVNEGNLADDSHSRLRDRENGNRYSCTMADIDSNQESNAREQQQQVRACYIEADNANVFGTNRNDVSGEEKEAFRETETFENYHHLSRDTSAQYSLHAINRPKFSDKSEDDRKRSTVSMTQDDRDNDHCSNELSNKCQSFGYNNTQKQQTNTQQVRKCSSKRNDESHKCVASLQTNQIQDNVEMRIPSENAAEPCEVAHAPEGASELMERTLDTPSTSPTADDTVVLRDTAAILQELALQRLSGSAALGNASARRRYESETIRDRRSFDSEIGREIVRERRMRQELDCARGKSEESSQHLPPCLRARHARATRAALSRSLDEAKFHRMTGEIPTLSVKQTSEDAQHCSTPNVGGGGGGVGASEKIQLRNLGGLDLGDPQCRERIEKYKEERRMFLRDKYRSESFRGISSKATEDDSEQALLTRLKQRASRPSLH